MKIYGVLDKDMNHIDVSNSLLGAKQYATRRGYNKVSSRADSGYYIVVEAMKIKGKWEKA